MADNPYYIWLNEKKLAINTQKMYRHYYKRFNLHPFTQQGIDNFFAMPKINNSMSRGMLKNLLEFLGMEDQFKLPPKPSGKRKKKIVRDLSMAQIEAIRHQAYTQNANSGFMFDFLYYGALRRSEVCNLKINSFNWNEWFEDWQKLPEYPLCQPKDPCALTIELGKGNKDRIVMIPAHVTKKFVDFYMDRIKLHPDHISDLITKLSSIDEYVFRVGNGDRLKGKKVWDMMRQISKKAIGIMVRPHELRHARATELEKSGQDIRAIQHYLGHSNPSITETYLHTSEKHSLAKIKESMANQNI